MPVGGAAASGFLAILNTNSNRTRNILSFYTISYLITVMGIMIALDIIG